MDYNPRLLVFSDSSEVETAMRRIGVDPQGIEIMLAKAKHYVLQVDEIKLKAAVILKQEMLSCGGEAAVPREVVNLSLERTPVILMGTARQFNDLAAKLRRQYFGLPRLAAEIEAVLAALEQPPGRILDCRGRCLALGGRTLVMGILNVTPDSFSDGGLYLDPSAAVRRALEMVEEGADIIDVGAVSTRPGYQEVTEDEEWRRLEPVITALVETIEVPVSVDTWRSKTARAALEAGAHLINDQWGLQADADLPDCLAYYGAPVILMHNHQGSDYPDLLGEVVSFLRRGIDTALKAGIPEEKILVDPGIGFGKTTAQNLEVLRRLGELRVLGKPIVLATSRKSFIGQTLDLDVGQRLEGTLATVALGISQGADVVRVHDVLPAKRVARMADAVLRRRPEGVGGGQAFA